MDPADPRHSHEGHEGHKRKHPKRYFRMFCDPSGRNCTPSDEWGGPVRQQMEGSVQPVLENRAAWDVALLVGTQTAKRERERDFL